MAADPDYLESTFAQIDAKYGSFDDYRRTAQETDGRSLSMGTNLLLADSFNLWWTPQNLAMTKAVE